MAILLLDKIQKLVKMANADYLPPTPDILPSRFSRKLPYPIRFPTTTRHMPKPDAYKPSISLPATILV